MSLRRLFDYENCCSDCSYQTLKHPHAGTKRGESLRQMVMRQQRCNSGKRCASAPDRETHDKPYQDMAMESPVLESSFMEDKGIQRAASPSGDEYDEIVQPTHIQLRPIHGSSDLVIPEVTTIPSFQDFCQNDAESRL
eukprot:m.157960 g.157960  ORF g.157960 m.157960 type:complete len:138 (-) comp10239_c1_seq1:68-481(-)